MTCAKYMSYHSKIVLYIQTSILYDWMKQQKVLRCYKCTCVQCNEESMQQLSVWQQTITICARHYLIAGAMHPWHIPHSPVESQMGYWLGQREHASPGENGGTSAMKTVR